MKMKKLLVMSALAVVSTAFVACSSDDDLVQQPPVVPEETVAGTPFSVKAYIADDTRATLYDADAWDGSNASNYVGEFKLYGKQGDNDPWMNSVVFHRDGYNEDWIANRSADIDAINPDDVKWPTTDTSTPTSFYAITDNDLGTGKTATITGVSPWMTTLGKFTYSMPKANANIPQIDPSWGTGYLIEGGVSTPCVTTAELKDLMVASATKKESETTAGQLNLAFTHALAGLSVKLIFRNDNFKTSGIVQNIHYIKIMGLNTTGTYNFNPTGTNPNWESLSGANDVCYYKAFATPIQITAVAEGTTPAAADNNVWLVDKTDPWMVIPQTTTPWNCQACASNSYIEDGSAYIVLGISDENVEDMEIFLPLNTTFVAGTNKILRLDLGAFRDLYQNSTGEAPYFYLPATGGGSGARGYDFIDEE